MATVRMLIWYAGCLAFVLLVWYVGSGFRVAIVDEGFTSMRPTIEPKGLHVLDRRVGTLRSLERDSIIAFRLIESERETKNVFGRVIAVAGMTVSVREGRLLVDGTEVGNATSELGVLRSGFIVPRDTVFVTFDAGQGGELTVPQHVVSYRNIIGRVMGR